MPSVGLTRTRQTWRQLMLWLGLVALLVQTLVPICVTGTASGPGGTSIVICTVKGTETIRLDADGKPAPVAPDSGHDSCFLGLGCHMAAGFVAPQMAGLVPPSLRVHDVLAVSETPAPARSPYQPYSSRAPPRSNETMTT